MAQIYDRGDARPKRTLTFNIEVTDDGETHGPFFRERRTLRNWRRIGTITFDQAVVSYNGDFVIHFHHPTWRDDQNDPATATRVNERKVRRPAQKTLSLPSSMRWRRMRVGGLANKSRFPTK
jgi:hypothetical protein